MVAKCPQPNRPKVYLLLTAVTVSEAEKGTMKPSLETLSPPQRNEVFPKIKGGLSSRSCIRKLSLNFMLQLTGL
jgi:hypothetical protein